MRRLPDDQWLLDEAGAGALARGLDYYKKGRVRLTLNTAQQLHAEAMGSARYTLVLMQDAEDWNWDCTCPAAEDGDFCKHLVAAVLVARGEADAASSIAGVTATPTAAKVRQSSDKTALLAFLSAQSVTTLANWLHELALVDREIEQRLQLYRAAEQPETLKTVLGKLLNTGGFLDYRASRRYAARLETVIAQLQAVLPRDPEACRGLCEYVLKRLFKSYANSDDSAGSIGGCMQAIAMLHQQACLAAPSGKSLGKSLYGLKALDEWGFFPLDRYWDALAADGQRDYAKRVLADFEVLPPPNPHERYGEARSVCRHAEELAGCMGDFDLLQRVLRRDLSTAYDHLRVFTSLRVAEREREALAWAEQAVKRFPRDVTLRMALADSLIEAGLNEEAAEQAWQHFCLDPGDGTWRRLQQFAGPNDWPAWRTRALAFVSDHEKGVVSLRIDLLRLDEDIKAALALARSHKVEIHAAARLAEHVQKSHPHDAGALYLRAAKSIASTLETRSNYDALLEYLKPASRLLPATEWQPLLVELREKYRRKRKLMVMLDEVLPE